MSKYCKECGMLSYDDTRCEYCGKPIGKINELQDQAQKKQNIPHKTYERKIKSTKNKQCPTCQHQISTKTIQCPSCGEIYFWKLILIMLQVGAFFALLNLIGYIIVYKIFGIW